MLKAYPKDVNTENCYKCIWNEIEFCEVPSDWQENKDIYSIEIDGVIRQMWLCKQPTGYDEDIEEMDIVYARCYKSMLLLDPIMRDYVLNIEYENEMVYAIKAVAGSGKTTILLDIAKSNPRKKILYLAFNRAIVTDIRRRKHKVAKNIQPYTFDALMRRLYIKNNPGIECNITDLRPVTFGDIRGYEWFAKKSFKMKQDLINIYNGFCKNTLYNDIALYIKKFYPTVSEFSSKTLIKLWNDTKQNRIITFNSIRKMALIHGWFKTIDAEFDLIFIDEAQDFDKIMLKMLLEQCKLPKIFVGDPKQAIYKWRGAINSFNLLPVDSHIVEFYKTWRIGNPACKDIREKFTDCWMVAGTNNDTQLHENVSPKDVSYHYLFRSWKGLLNTASNMSNIWINDFENKRRAIKRLHPKLLRFGQDAASEFEDDLPNFLLKLSPKDLEDIITNIERNLVDRRVAKCCMFTIHAYKGLEQDNIRIFSDIDDEDEELFYVALTRGKKHIYLDE